MPIEIPEINEGGAYGAAMLAAVGNGKIFEEISKWIKVKSTVEPEKKWVEFYDSWYHEYRMLYVDLRERFKAIDANRD